MLSDELEFNNNQDDMNNDGSALPVVGESFDHVAPPAEAAEQLSNDTVSTEDEDGNEVMGLDGRAGLGKTISSIARIETLARTRTTFVEHSVDLRNQQPTLSDRPTITRLGPHRTLRARLGPHRRLQNQQNADVP